MAAVSVAHADLVCEGANGKKNERGNAAGDEEDIDPGKRPLQRIHMSMNGRFHSRRAGD